MTGVCPAGFPHSEISGSMDICSSPKLIAAYHVFHRLLVPRHPPCALFCLTRWFAPRVRRSPKAYSVTPLVLGLCSLDFAAFLPLSSDVATDSICLTHQESILIFVFQYAVFKVHVKDVPSTKLVLRYCLYSLRFGNRLALNSRCASTCAH